MKLGILSDIHKQAEKVVQGIEKLKDMGAERLILNGDIGEFGELEKSQAFSERILEAVGRSGLEAYVQPGSHETIAGYGTIVSILSQQYGNIHDMTRESSVDIAGYRLLFLPGSDVHSGGEYHLDEKIPSGRYAVTEDGLVRLENVSLLQELIRDHKVQGIWQYKNIQDAVPLIENPERSIIVCHIPARFTVGPQGVDFSYFAETPDGNLMAVALLERKIQELVRQREGREARAEEIVRIAEANGFSLKKENVGNTPLRQFFDAHGIRYAVNGHIHECGHHAHDRKGHIVPEYKNAEELFWNSGCFDRGQMGILSLDDTGVAYQNVRL